MTIVVMAGAAATAVAAWPGPGSHPRGVSAAGDHAAAATQDGSAVTGTTAAQTTSDTTASGSTALLAAGQQGTRQDVPWSKVGPGWILATWNKTRTGPTTLFLIDPAGGRYSLDTLPAEAANSTQDYYPAAWSGDGQRALLDSDTTSADVAVLNLRTGTEVRFSLGSGVSPVGFTRPDGLAILADAGREGTRSHLERFSLTGALEQTYPTSFTGGGYYNGGQAAYSPDGTQIAVGTSSTMELISNDGHVIRALPVSPSAQYCTPSRWWTATEVLAACFPPHSSVAQLWLVPASGAPATALTASPAAGGDYGDLDAWPLPSGTYVQDAGACGYVYLAKLQANKQTAPVTVPGVKGDSVIVVGSYADRLAIQARTPCGAGSALLWYSAAHGTTTPLLGGTAAGGGTEGSAFLFGEPANGL